MSQLEPPASEQADAEPESECVVSLPGRAGTVSIPEDATAAEAAAVAVAVGAHLTDRQTVAAAAAAERPVETVDQWVLAARLRRQGKRHWPRDVERGDEWRAAARSF